MAKGGGGYGVTRQSGRTLMRNTIMGNRRRATITRGVGAWVANYREGRGRRGRMTGVGAARYRTRREAERGARAWLRGTWGW